MSNVSINPYTICGIQDMIGEPEEEILENFKEKANKCSSKEHMRIFCQSYLKKYESSPLKLSSDWNMAPTTKLTCATNLDSYNYSTVTAIEKDILISETKRQIAFSLMQELVRKNFVEFSQDYKPNEDSLRITAKIRVGKPNETV